MDLPAMQPGNLRKRGGAIGQVPSCDPIQTSFAVIIDRFFELKVSEKNKHAAIHEKAFR